MLFLSSGSGVFATSEENTISGNGANSNNSITVVSSCPTDVKQINDSNVKVNLDVSSNTGGNKANGNTGGDVTIDTGAATSSLVVNVDGGLNEASVNPCCCDTSSNSSIKDNGAESANTVTTASTNSYSQKQKNKKTVKVKGSVKSSTGKNKAKKNTGGVVEIKTDDGESSAEVTVTGDFNTLNPVI